MISIFYVIWVLFASSCLKTGLKYTSESAVVLVASSPGNFFNHIIARHTAGKKVDFIRWDLTLTEGSAGAIPFVLNKN